MVPSACCSTLRKPSLVTRSRTPTESVAGLGVAVADLTGCGVGVLDGLRTGVGVGEIQGVLDKVGLGAGGSAASDGVPVVPQDVVTAKPAMTPAAVMTRWVRRRLNTGTPWP